MPELPTDSPYVDRAAKAIALVAFGPSAANLLTEEAYAESVAQIAASPVTRKQARAALEASGYPVEVENLREELRLAEADLKEKDDAIGRLLDEAEARRA